MASASFVFVSQAGKLEGMSLLLAATLRAKIGFEAEIIAATPTPGELWGSLSKGALNAFEELEVKVEPIVNPFGKKYPIGNKFGCMTVDANSPRRIFLDTDIVILNDIDLPTLCSGDLAVVPATRNHIPIDVWKAAYRLFDLNVDEIDLAGAEFPYFNSGMVSASANGSFGDAWLKTAQILEEATDIPLTAKRPWLDQFALPITARLQALEVTELDDSFNFPSWDKKRSPNSKTSIYHYQRPAVLLRTKELFNNVTQATAKWPVTRSELRKHPHVRMFCSPVGYRRKALWHRTIKPKLGM